MEKANKKVFKRIAGSVKLTFLRRKLSWLSFVMKKKNIFREIEVRGALEGADAMSDRFMTSSAITSSNHNFLALLALSRWLPSHFAYETMKQRNLSQFDSISKVPIIFPAANCSREDEDVTELLSKVRWLLAQADSGKRRLFIAPLRLITLKWMTKTFPLTSGSFTNFDKLKVISPNVELTVSRNSFVIESFADK